VGAQSTRQSVRTLWPMLTVRRTVMATVLISLGCGGGGGSGKQMLPGIEKLVSEVPDGSRNPTSFKALFAADATVPEKDRKKYGKGYFMIESKEGDDDTATIQVVYRDIDGNEQGKASWTVVKEGDQWKLESAPLP